LPRPLSTSLLARLARRAPFLLARRTHVRLAFLLRDPVPIAAARPGDVVKVVGIVRALPAPLTAPFSGQACAYHQSVALAQDQRGRWVMLLDATEGRDFVVDDGSAQALVRIAGAELALLDDAAAVWRPDLPPAGARFVGEALASRPLRFRETALADGHEVAVVGRARRLTEPDCYRHGAPYRGGPAPALLLERGQAEALLVTDDPMCWRRTG
jgi:hypothetical protein